ncbi:hypothetical protein COBT_000136 [Conglomerata obtusa]
MIIIPPDSTTVRAIKHLRFHNEPYYDLDSHKIVYPDTTYPPHNFFPPISNPSVVLKSNPIAETFSKQTFLYSFNHKKFIVFNSKFYYQFQLRQRAKKALFIDDQIFLNTTDNFFSVTVSKIQSLNVKNIDFDINKVSKRIFFLQKDKIEILDGNVYPISCETPKFIRATDHPQEVLLATSKNLYMIDLRQKGIAKELYKATRAILDVKYTSQNIAIKEVLVVSLLRNLRLYEGDTIENGTAYNIVLTSKELISHNKLNFIFFDVDDLSRFSAEKYGIDEYCGFTANDKKYCFFKGNGVTFFMENSWKHYKHRLYEAQIRRVKTDFFDDNECWIGDRTNEYGIGDINVKSYNKIMNEIDNANVFDSKTQTEKKQINTQKITRNSGF